MSRLDRFEIVSRCFRSPGTLYLIRRSLGYVQSWDRPAVASHVVERGVGNRLGVEEAVAAKGAFGLALGVCVGYSALDL